MARTPRTGLLLLLVLGLLAVVSHAQDTPAPSTGDAATDKLIEQERVRAGVEEAFESYLQPVSDGRERVDIAIDAMESLRALGPSVVPFLAAELETGRKTMDLSAYALGMLGTPEAEEALRAAVKRAEENPSTGAKVLKAWAVWSLSLMGAADAVQIDCGTVISGVSGLIRTSVTRISSELCPGFKAGSPWCSCSTVGNSTPSNSA